LKSRTECRALITGGSGFVGSNLAARLLQHPSAHVTVFDSLARPGVERNLAWLQALAAPGQLTVIRGDVRDRALLAEAAQGATEIYHFAAQVAVTTSIADPLDDCHTNILGTLHVLEAARKSRRQPLVLFTSTNKVYGSLEGVPVHRAGDHYAFAEAGFRGVPEIHPLDFHSPYGCSKGAADQYVHDYARIYNVPTVVFRMSCIAGPRQLGTEDQGWVAHFLYSALEGEPVTIYGDGCQVRDILHVHDLVDAMERAAAERRVTAGEIYNVGGGLRQAISVRQALAAIEGQTGIAINAHYAEARPGDQQIYISDTAKLSAHTGWQPTRSLDTILADIADFWHSDLRGRRGRAVAAEPAQQLAGAQAIAGRG
jgi:CDP-paratose 2-epimerase